MLKCIPVPDQVGVCGAALAGRALQVGCELERIGNDVRQIENGNRQEGGNVLAIEQAGEAGEYDGLQMIQYHSCNGKGLVVVVADGMAPEKVFNQLHKRHEP